MEEKLEPFEELEERSGFHGICNGAAGDGCPSKSLPKFAPKPNDPYIKPEVGSLITYIWQWEPDLVYRTGVLCSGVAKGSIRFFDGLRADGRPDFVEYQRHLNKDLFRKAYFRTRSSDLKTGNYCFDSMKNSWCQFMHVDVESGGVKVLYLDESAPVLISPDDLVGASPAAYKSIVNTTTTNASKRTILSSTKTNSDSNQRSKRSKANEWFGVYEGTQELQDYDAYYIRGKLRETPDGGPPLLIEGECVEYCSRTGKAADPEILFFDGRKRQHLKVDSKKEREKYKQSAKRGEEAHANKLKLECNQRRMQSVLQFRPFQLVYVDGGSMVEAEVLRAKDDLGFVRVRIIATGKIEMKPYSDVRLLGKPDQICLEEFFCIQEGLVPKQKDSYRKDPNYLLQAWRNANKDKFQEVERKFEQLVEARARVRDLASVEGVGGTRKNGMVCRPSADAMDRLERRASVLLHRLQEDFRLPREESMMEYSDFKSRILEVKHTLPYPNLLLLCGGIAPEVTAYKRTGAAPLGTVIIQDTDLLAVAVAVAAHPDVEFAIIVDPTPQSNCRGIKAPGDVRILRDRNILRKIEVTLGGIHNVSITNPCQTFSKAGLKDGFDDPKSELLFDCVKAVDFIRDSSEMPLYLAENVPSTREIDRQSDAYIMSPYFRACGSMCSPSTRDRKFSTNRPPVVCASSNSADARLPGDPPSLNGDLPHVSAKVVVEHCGDRVIHPKLKKFPCLTHSGPSGANIWHLQGKYNNPIPSRLTPEEAELAMGYKNEEVGVTKNAALKAVRKRIQEHNVERDGCLVSLKGCANDKDQLQLVSDDQRLKLLGNSQVVTLLEALLWNERRMFPAVVASDTVVDS